MFPLMLAASSLPVGIGLSRVPFVCQAPKPFLPCEINIAGKAVPNCTAFVFAAPRVKTAMSPSVQSANDVGEAGCGIGVVHGWFWLPALGGLVVVALAQVEAPLPSANAGDTR